MGGYDTIFAELVEPSLRDHSGRAKILMVILESGHLTLSGGQFFWGGSLITGQLNSNVKLYDLAICWNIRFLD